MPQKQSEIMQTPSSNNETGIRTEREKKRNLPLQVVVNEFKTHPDALRHRIIDPTINGDAYERIVAVVNEVAAEMDFKISRIITHKGSLQATAYNPDYNVLLVSEKAPEILTAIELRHVIAHELDHMSRIASFDKMDDWARKKPDPQKMPGIEKTRRLLMKTFPAFETAMEFKADDRANALYGAEAGYSAFIKYLIEQAMENPRSKEALFPEVDDDNLDKITRGQTETRIKRIADGELKGDISKMIAARLLRFRNNVKSGQEL